MSTRRFGFARCNALSAALLTASMLAALPTAEQQTKPNIVKK
jgi:hypothetical protein